MHNYFFKNKGTLAIMRSLLLAGSALSLIAGPTLIPTVSARNLLAATGTGAVGATSGKEAAKSPFTTEGSGTLTAMTGPGQKVGLCPLKHTAVTADISGYVARVTVKQTFSNPFTKKIEAVYTFPLAENGAVDEMVMKVGSRTIHGTIKKREEARQIYEEAMAQGHVASLLEQERSNIFTQSVANIEPGKDIEVTISYIETLPYESGKYSFAFPTVVGPRFIPGNAVSGGAQGGGFAPNTNQVPDASRITPTPVKEGERAGHDLSIDIHLNAGMPVSAVNSALHEVSIKNNGNSSADISLVNKNTIPNKDFVLSWNVAEDTIKSGYLTYKNKEDKDGYFTLMLMPPKRVTPATTAPKELIFVIDCSGSQSGAPLQKAKDAMLYMLDHMNSNDTFQIITFNNSVETFSAKPELSSDEMKGRARDFINKMQARGGTWMAPAVEKACSTEADSHRLRIVTFMTDGYVGNDFEILGLVKKLRGNSRWFPFGTGNSVNRMLIDGMAKEGGGEAEYVLLNSSAQEVGKKFYERIGSPVLTDVKLSFDGLEVKEVFPKEVSDVYAERPLYFKGRYTAPRAGTITLTGFSAGKPYKQTMHVNFPEADKKNPGIASLWARAKVDRLMSEDWFGAQQGQVNKEIKDELIATALKHHIMTQYTSFVAVDDSVKTKGDKAEKVNVPIEMPDGVSREGVFGNAPGSAMPRRMAATYAGRKHKVAYNMPSFQAASMPYGANQANMGRMVNNYNVGFAPSAMPAPSVASRAGVAGGGGAGGSTSSGSASTMDWGTVSRMRVKGSPRQAEAKMSLPEMSKVTYHEQMKDGRTAINEQELRSDEKLSVDLLAAMKKADRQEEASGKAQLKPAEKAPAARDKTSRVLVNIKLKVNKLSAAQRKALEALSVEIKEEKKSREIKASVPLNMIKEIAKLSFVLKISLESDLK